VSEIVRRPGGTVSLVPASRRLQTRVKRAAAPTHCRWCGRSTSNQRGVVEHFDYSPGGVHWAEHAACTPKQKDWLAPEPSWRLP
jgi:hypothetical protein